MPILRNTLIASLILHAGFLGAQSISETKTYPQFPVGPTGFHVSIEPGLKVTVQSIQKGSPAEHIGLKIGDVLVTIGGKALKTSDPRVTLGQAIGIVEADDGELLIEVMRDGASKEIMLQLKPLGAYRVTWPEKCPKSRSIIEASARRVSKALQDEGHYNLGETRLEARDLKACLAGLFLLSTGNDSYLPAVGNQARLLAKAAETRSNAGGHINWQLGYQGIFLGEYYLRTGDQQILKGLKEICDWAAEGPVSYTHLTLPTIYSV